MDLQKEVEALFEKALDLAPAERTAFLNAIRARDPALYQELASLLEALEDDPGFFDRLSDTFVSPIISHFDGEPPAPDHVGAYRIVREVGRGGMSTVYLAERADGQFEQQVALKLVRAGLDQAARLQHLVIERQILASLNHPNIARLYDGGVTPDGRPYLVMEYVEGESIDRYCDARCLSLADRLRLFQVVIEAVQYAHRNLIVHRDLKPSNVLVVEPASGQPRQGHVRLLDFGIAKLLEADGDATPPSSTQTGARWLTPEYAAPEQIRGERITTATDVYQLGVMLYRLLTGHRPYRVSTTSTYEIERAVCEEEPTRPSTIVAKVEERRQGEAMVRITPEAVSQTRATALNTLRRTLSGDLDAILLKALRKEPEQRYVTAEAFAEDIQRYLEGRPVRARRGTWGYHARKYVQRNAWRVGAAAVIVLLLLGYAATVTVQRRQVAEERDRAQREADKAEEMTSFLMDLFEISDPDEAQGETVTAREMLDNGARRIQQELDEQPEVQALMMNTIGQVYEKLGLYDDALILLDTSLALRRRLFSPPHADIAGGLYALAEGHASLGDYDQAETHLREAIAMWRRLPDNEEQLAESLVFLALLHKVRSRYAAADSLYHEALAIQHRVLGDEHPDIAATLNNLAASQSDQGRYAAADSLYRTALAMQRKLLGDHHSHLAATLNNLAFLREAQGRYPEADSLYQESLAIHMRLLGEDHPTVARIMNNLGRLRSVQGDYAAAERLLRQAMILKEHRLGPEHLSLAASYFALADLMYHTGNVAAAESLYRQTLTIERKVYGNENPEIATDLTRLASVLHARGNRDEADSLFAQALGIARRTLPADHPRLATTLLGYGRLRLDEERAHEAEALLQEALTIREAAYAAADWRRAEAQAALGACYTALGRLDEAEALLLPSYRILHEHRHEAGRSVQQALYDLVTLYEARGNPTQAATYRARLSP